MDPKYVAGEGAGSPLLDALSSIRGADSPELRTLLRVCHPLCHLTRSWALDTVAQLDFTRGEERPTTHDLRRLLANPRLSVLHITYGQMEVLNQMLGGTGTSAATSAVSEAADRLQKLSKLSVLQTRAEGAPSDWSDQMQQLLGSLRSQQPAGILDPDHVQQPAAPPAAAAGASGVAAQAAEPAGCRVTLQELHLLGYVDPFPTELLALTGLKRLGLGDWHHSGHGRISCNLPDDISSLRQLEYLDVSGRMSRDPDDPDHLSTLILPAGLSSLEQLNTLHLNYNQLVQLPPWLGNLTQLRNLGLAGTKLGGVPHVVVELTQLTRLDISDNGMGQLPDYLSALVQLQRLNAHHNQLQQLPDWLGTLSQLQVLDVSHNELQTLPTSLRTATSLRRVIAYANPLIALPLGLTATVAH